MSDEDNPVPTKDSMPLRSFFNTANSLTFGRLCLAPALGWSIARVEWWLAACIIIAAIITDVFDGKLARRQNTVAPLGALFDHGTDAILVSVGAWALAEAGVINPWLWPLITLAFLQYALDSRVLTGHVLRTSKLGKYNGIGYYILICAAIGSEISRSFAADQSLSWLQVGVSLAAWLLLISTLASMTDRLIHVLRRPVTK